MCRPPDLRSIWRKIEANRIASALKIVNTRTSRKMRLVVRCAFTAVVTLDLAGRRRDRLADLADELVGRFHGSNRMPTKLNHKDVAATQG
jgi:hypothetical protein